MRSPKSLRTSCRHRSMPGGETRRGDDRPVLDVERVGIHVDRREAPGKLGCGEPMGRRSAAIQQARVGQREGASADRRHPRAPCRGVAQGAERGGRRRVEATVARYEHGFGRRHRRQAHGSLDRKAGGRRHCPGLDRAGSRLVQRPLLVPGEREDLGGRREIEGDDWLNAKQRDTMWARTGHLAEI